MARDGRFSTQRQQTEVIIHHGVVDTGSMVVEYTTRQPAPAQWVAVSVVPSTVLKGRSSQRSLMVVGVGTTEDDAVQDLSDRLDDMSGASHSCAERTFHRSRSRKR
jgi:hypothetical protein